MQKKSHIYLIFCYDLENMALKEAITSNYISKKANENLTMILLENDEKAINIFNKLTKNISESEMLSIGLFIMKISDYYGILDNSAWEWLEENTDIKLVRETTNTKT